MHDENGYTIIQDAKGYYVYAVLAEGKLIPSEIMAGRDDPAKAGLTPGINLDPQEIGRIREGKARQMEIIRQKAAVNGKIPKAPQSGNFNNLVIFIRFADQNEYTSPISEYEGMFNSDPISLQNYFKEASYNQLTISSTLYPAAQGGMVISYQDSHNRNYFSPYHAETNVEGYKDETEANQREHQLLYDAVTSIDGQVPADLAIDNDSDGNADNVVFIIQGPADAWADLLWPHRWVLWNNAAYINGKRVWDYNFQLSESTGVSVLCHEMFHSIGAPDLYRYQDKTISPVARWDLMSNNTTPPQHMTAYMKYRYGKWIDTIPEIQTSGTYALSPLSTASTGSYYKIASPYSTSEYFMVEYRSQTHGTFDQGVPGSGIIVYRINTAKNGSGNAYGPPDELYVYRPDGTPVVNGQWLNAHFSSNVSRTQINDDTNPSSFLSDGLKGGLNISGIGAVGDTLSFTVQIPLATNPEMDVKGNNISIADGDASPSDDDHTDFGNTAVAGGTVVRTFTIENSGDANLTIGEITFSGDHASDFSVTLAPVSPVVPSGAALFTVTFDPSKEGKRTAEIRIVNNDGDENPYHFTLQGLGAIPGDADNDGDVDLADAIAVLKIMAGLPESVNVNADVNGDQHIGIEEIIYILRNIQ
jgi:M6 family metalloprotease-like protein